MLILVYLLILLKLVQGEDQQCQPFGLRLNYGRIVYNDSQQKLGIRFNTKISCNHLSIIINNQTVVPCSSERHKYFLRNYKQTKSIYTTHIHKCSLTNEIYFDEEFTYNLLDTDNKQLILKENIKIYIKNPKNQFLKFSFINIADWGPITNQNLRQKLQQSTPHLLNHIIDNKIDGLILNGDIGYELNSNEQFHEKVMTELSIFASRVPIIVNRGNHEVNQIDNNVGTMYQQYFQIYDQELKDCTKIKIGKNIFVLVDPYKLLIPRLYRSFTQEQLYKSLKNFIQILNTTEMLQNNVIVLSHYPLVCGFPAVEHCIPDSNFNQILPLYINLKGFYDAVLKFNVPLVLSGHVHTYERTFPMSVGYRVNTSEMHTYLKNKQTFFIQVIEGCSGSNDGILNSTNKLLQIYHYQSRLTAKKDLDKLGYGLLHLTNTEVLYEHFSIQLNGSPYLSDNFTINFNENQKMKIQVDL